MQDLEKGVHTKNFQQLNIPLATKHKCTEWYSSKQHSQDRLEDF